MLHGVAITIFTSPTFPAASLTFLVCALFSDAHFTVIPGVIAVVLQPAQLDKTSEKALVVPDPSKRATSQMGKSG